MEFFSRHHRTWPGYDFFEFQYEVENIRIEARETRDLLQDLRDVAEGLTVVHDSDLKAAAKVKKQEAKAKRMAAKDRRIRKNTVARFYKCGDDPRMERLFRQKLGDAEYERLKKERDAAAAGIGEQFSIF